MAYNVCILCTTLLGHQQLQSIRLNWGKLGIANVHSLSVLVKSLLQKDKIFRNDIGTMEHFRAKLVIKLGAKT